MISAKEAITRLRKGNQRFVADQSTATQESIGQARRAELAGGQAPFAIILGCSDSRVPAELVFDQGLGDLFVIRVAGHVVAPSQTASVEFAASQFGTPLVVVLGHSKCGAVAATIDQLSLPPERRAKSLAAITERIAPAVAPLLETRTDDQLAHAVRANIRIATSQLRSGSAVLERLVSEGKLGIVGAEYSLETGAVEFLDEV